jgi:hypothetical protein
MRHYEALALLHGKPKQQAELAQAIRQRELKGPQAKRAAQAVKAGKAKSIEDALRQGVTKPPEKKKAEPQARGDRVAEILGEMMKMSMRLRGLSGAGLTPSQRARMAGGMEALRDDMNWVIDFVRREEK